jgi:GNAT superfamily N-acetyltransferase
VTRPRRSPISGLVATTDSSGALNGKRQPVHPPNPSEWESRAVPEVPRFPTYGKAPTNRWPADSCASYRRAVITYEWRGRFDDVEVNRLHAEGFGSSGEDWWVRVNRHSLGWVCAREGDALVGFVNVAWDGAAHAFVLDTVVSEGVRRRGVGSEVVAVAARHARDLGCAWLHVDFEDHLRPFYLDRCGFRSTSAGLVALSGEPGIVGGP